MEYIRFTALWNSVNVAAGMTNLIRGHNDLWQNIDKSWRVESCNPLPYHYHLCSEFPRTAVTVTRLNYNLTSTQQTQTKRGIISTVNKKSMFF